MVKPGAFPLQPGMKGRATRLVVMGVSPMVLQREAIWISNALIANVGANMEDTLRVLRMLSGRKYRRKQPGKGTRRGKDKEEELKGEGGGQGERVASASCIGRFRLRLIHHCRWVSRGESGDQKGGREMVGGDLPPPLL